MNVTQFENGVYQFEPLKVRVEIWPVAADEVGIWLLSGIYAWRSLPIRADTNPHRAVEDILHEQEAAPQLLHSTSWRMDEDALMVTYIAVIECQSPVRQGWPEAKPVSDDMLQAVGKPSPTEPTESPVPREIDVLAHAIRHLRFLLDTDAEARQGLGEDWRSRLKELSPTLTGMYERE